VPARDGFRSDVPLAAAQAGSQERGPVVQAEPAEAAVRADSPEPELVVRAELEEAVVQVWDYFPDACSGSNVVAPELSRACSPMAALELPKDDCSAVQPAAAPTDGYPAAGFQVQPDVAAPDDWFPELPVGALR